MNFGLGVRIAKVGKRLGYQYFKMLNIDKVIKKTA